MASNRFVVLGSTVLLLLLPAAQAPSQQTANPPLPAIPDLMRQVEQHQKALEQIVENYTYTSVQTTQELDAGGQVKKTETSEYDVFFVHGVQIDRLVKKNGQPLSGRDLKKETERVTKAVEKAENPQSSPSRNSQTPTVSRLLEIVDVRNPRRVSYRGRPTIVFDIVGRRNAKTHGLVEEAYKKLQGMVWVDEADRQVAHFDLSLDDNFHLAGGLLANIEKGARFSFDQTPVNGEVWLPTGAEVTAQLHLFLVKGVRLHFTERDFDYRRFQVDARQNKKDVRVIEDRQPAPHPLH